MSVAKIIMRSQSVHNDNACIAFIHCWMGGSLLLHYVTSSTTLTHIQAIGFTTSQYLLAIDHMYVHMPPSGLHYCGKDWKPVEGDMPLMVD